MSVEPITLGSLPNELDSALPAGGDPKAEGDDHIRNIKITLKNFYNVWLSTNVNTRLLALESYIMTGDAITLNGQPASFYQNADNLNAGTVPVARLSGTYNINITGTAANATNAVDAVHALTADVATLASAADSIGGLTAAQIAASFAAVSRVNYNNPSIQNFSGSGWQTALSDVITIASPEFLFMSLFVNSLTTLPSNYPYMQARVLIDGVEVFRDVVNTDFEGRGLAPIRFNSVMLPWRQIITGLDVASLPIGMRTDIPVGVGMPIEVQLRRIANDGGSAAGGSWSIDQVDLNIAGLGVS